MNRVDWDSSSHTERMTPCIGLRAAYRNSIASTTNASTEKATLLGQNNHEFQVVITGSSHYSYGCFSHTVTDRAPRWGQGLQSHLCRARSQSDIAPGSVQKAPHCMPINTPGVFSDLQPRIQPHLLRLVIWTMRDRLLAALSVHT